MQLVLELLIFGFAWWLGLKLLQRREADPAPYLMGWGLIVYAVTIVLRSLRLISSESIAASMTSFEIGLTLIPLVLWLVALSTIVAKHRASAETRPRALIIAFTISLGLGIGLILLRTTWLPDSLLLLAIGVDLVVLGYAVAVLDAFEQGETVQSEYLRSLLESEAVAWLFGGQIAIVMWLTTGVTLPMVALLYTVIATAIAVTVFFNRIQANFDRLVFGRNPSLRQERATLRDVAEALPRSNAPVSAEIDWSMHDIDQLTRRALSNMGNLPKLATSPLRLLPQIDQRLIAKGTDDSVLARAAELKQLLTESICKLKPSDNSHFDSTDSWRHYNALYFPYIRGLRPYSRRFILDVLDETDRAAMEWFQREVPPRTLYNWQAAAAKLISAELQQHLNQTA